jgi:uridine kinase
MKIAILIAGYLRTFQDHIPYFIDNIIQNYDVDIYIHKTGDENKDKYNNKVNWNDIKKKIKPKFILETKDLFFNVNNKINNLMNQFYKFYMLNNIKNSVIEETNINYDIVIKWRPDILLNQHINFEDMEKNIVYIPSDSKIDINKLNNKQDKYICDIIAYGDNNSMNNYFNFYKSLNKLIEKYGSCQENLLYHYMNNFNYKEVNIDYSVILSTCRIISITGNSGSGKTTLSNYLKKDILNSFILECDRYHKWERGDKNWNNFTHLNPNSNYITKMQKDVFNLKIGNGIHQVNYDHNTGKFTSQEFIESKNTIIVCGLHSLYNNNSNINIFMDTETKLNSLWKIKRDVKKRGYSVTKVLENIKNRENDYIKYILPQKNNADIIINFYTDDDISYTNLDKILKINLNLFIKKKYNIQFLFLINNKLILEDFGDFYKVNIKDGDYNTIIKYVINNLNI